MLFCRTDKDLLFSFPGFWEKNHIRLLFLPTPVSQKTLIRQYGTHVVYNDNIQGDELRRYGAF